MTVTMPVQALTPTELQALVDKESPYASVVLSPQGVVWWWGAAAERILGWSIDEAVGRRLEEFTVPAFAVEDWRTQLADARGGARAGRVVARRCRSGELSMLEVTYRAVLDDRGEVACYVSAKRDVTDEQVQLDIERLAERFRGVVETLPDAIVVVNSIGAIVMFNEQAQRLFGLSALQALGQPVELLLPPQQRAAHVGHRAGFLGHPQRRTMGSGLDLHGQRADGERFPVEVSLSPFEIAGHGYVLSAIRDQTERRRIEDALTHATAAERANAAKTEFLSRVSHELRTPLNAVLGFAQLLLLDRQQPLGERHVKQVQRIEEAGRHLLSMINDLLDISRIESGMLGLSTTPVSVVAVCDEVIALTVALAAEAGVSIEPRRGSERTQALADAVRLRQVLLNLVSNAIKYNRPGGQVSIFVAEQQDEVAITVADTGAGLSAEQVAQLYQPFNRLGAERSKVEGTGIGLVISRKLAEAMGGRLEVTSEPGVGSIFSLRLPRA